MGTRTDLNWDAIRTEYRLGQISVRQIAQKHGCTHAAISKRAKAEGWEHDLMGQVAAETQIKLIELEKQQVATPVTTVTTLNARDRDAIEMASRSNVEVVKAQRADLAMGQALVRRLFAELIESTEKRDEIKEAIDKETANDQNPFRKNMMERAVSLPSRAQVMKTLADAMVRLIGAEREAFNLDTKLDVKELSTEQLYELVRYHRSRD